MIRSYLYRVFYNGRSFMDVRALCGDDAVEQVLDTLRARGVLVRIEFVECVGD